MAPGWNFRRRPRAKVSISTQKIGPRPGGQCASREQERMQLMMGSDFFSNPWRLGRAVCTAGLLLPLGLGAVGCGQRDNPASTTSAEPQAPPASTITADSPSPLTSSSAAPAPVPQTRVDDRRAEELLARLSTPGLTLEEWEQTHADLVGLGESAIRVLARTLREGNDLEREQASMTLALFGSEAESAISALKGALEDSSEFVRANAAATLVQLPEHAAAAIPALVTLLKSSDPQLRQLAATNLHAAGPAAEQHVAELADALTLEQPSETLVPIVELLGQIGPAAGTAVPRLEQIAGQQQGEVSAAASQAIQLISGAAAAAP